MPSRVTIETLATWMARDDVRLHYWPRTRLRDVWRRTHGGRDVPVSRPYAFRGWASGSDIHILVDWTETAASIVWLTLHELAHVELACAPLIAQAYRNMPKSSRYLCDDEEHDARPEEQMADLVADELAALVGGTPGLNRRWWRRRADAMLAVGNV